MRLRGFKKSRRDPHQQQLIEEELHSVYVAPMWVGKMDNVRSLLKQVAEQQGELDELQKGHLKVRFGAGRDEEQEEVNIEQKTATISGLFKRAEKAIHELEAVYLAEVDDDDSDNGGATDAELTILRNVKMCLANEVVRQTKIFSEKQRKYLRDVQNQKGVIAKGKDEKQKAVQDALARDAMEDGYRQQGMTQEQIDMIMMSREQVDERVREFEQIAQSIKTLHEMFQDLNALVIEQGTILDRIDENMRVTHTRVVKGRKELEKAAKHQKAGCFKLLVLFLVVMIIGFILAIAIKAL